MSYINIGGFFMKALTFKEKQDVLEDLFKKYHRAVLQLKCLEEGIFIHRFNLIPLKKRRCIIKIKEVN